jgi:hypothetical protein
VKRCAKCRLFKELDRFSKKKSHKDGLGSYCKKCDKINNAVYYRANPDKVNAINENWKKKNPEKVKAYKAAWQSANPEKMKAAIAIWQKANPNRVKANSSAYSKANPEKRNAFQAKRRAAKLQRTPGWLTKEHFKQIEQFYIEAKKLTLLKKESFEVDHIVPLQGKNVSGLHVPWNLQILTHQKHKHKGNKF